MKASLKNAVCSAAGPVLNCEPDKLSPATERIRYQMGSPEAFLSLGFYGEPCIINDTVLPHRSRNAVCFCRPSGTKWSQLCSFGLLLVPVSEALIIIRHRQKVTIGIFINGCAAAVIIFVLPRGTTNPHVMGAPLQWQ